MPKEIADYLGSRLLFELVPGKLHGHAPRTYLSPGAWKKVGDYVRGRAGRKCEICGAKTRRLDAHERYFIVGETLVLARIMAVCPDCHLAIHPGYAAATGRLEECLARYAKINKCSLDNAYSQFELAMERWERLAHVDSIEFSMLAEEPYRSMLDPKGLALAEANAAPASMRGEPLAFMPERA